MVRKVVDFHDAGTALWQGLGLDRGIFPEFKPWQHESYRELVLSSIACAGLFAGKPAPTGTVPALTSVQYLWERACPAKRPEQTTDQLKVVPDVFKPRR